MTETREGPTVEIRSWCRGCKYEKVTKYQVQGDSGYDHECTQSGRAVDTGFDGRAPDWCPFIERAVLTKIGEVTGAKYEVKGQQPL